jgi:hypothetical protein
MRAYPQLSTGALVQFPYRRQQRTRVVENRLGDGRTIRWRDAAERRAQWELRYTGLTSAEKAALEQLFEDCGGRLRPFTFVEPGSNLFAWSEAATSEVWTKSPGATVTTGLTDPLGGTGAFRLSGGGLTQTRSLPGAWVYCVSGWARGGAGRAGVSGAAAARTRIQGEASWARFAVRCEPVGGESVTAGVWVEAGESVELFGLQWEAQPGASSYQRSGAATGIYPETFFEEDELRFVQEGPEEYSIALALESRLMD